MSKDNSVVIRSAYTGRVRVPFDCGKVSRTKQSFQAECDINTIMSKYERTGLIDHVNSFSQKFLDCSDIVDYQSALNCVQDAEDSFMALPSQIRAKFENNPALFFEFVNNPSNLDEMVNLGLAVRTSLPEQQKETSDTANQKAGVAEVSSDV